MPLHPVVPYHYKPFVGGGLVSQGLVLAVLLSGWYCRAAGATHDRPTSMDIAGSGPVTTAASTADISSGGFIDAKS